jgi:serine/threonine protein kinase
MSMILLAVEDAVRDAPVRDLLTAEGWWVTTVVSQEEALRAAADHAPQLLIVDAGLATPGALLRAFARQEGGPGVLVLVDSEGDAVPEDSDGVVWRDQSPSEILAVVRHSLHAPRTAAEHAPAPSEVTSEDEQLTTSELFGDILETLDGEVTPPPVTAPPEQRVEEPATKQAAAPEPELVEEPELMPEPEGAEIEEAAAAEEVPEPEEAEEATTQAYVGSESELAEEPEFVPEAEEVEPEEAAAAEEEPEPEPEEATAQAHVESETELVEEPEFVPEPEGAEIEEVAAESVSEAGVEEEAEEEPEPEVEIEILEQVVESKDGLESAAAAVDADDTDWLIERVLDEGSQAEEGLHEEGAQEPQSTSLAPEHSTDIEAAVDGLLAVEDVSWRDPASETNEIDRRVIDEVLAADEPATGESRLDEAELEDDEDLERLGPYKLFEMLEYGDLTERWLAERSDGAEGKVVVERIRPELQSRADVRQAFVDGYSEAAGWDQQNLLKVVDLGRDGDVDYVATEFHAGHSLREVLGRVQRMEARMPLGIGLLLAERIVAGLQELGGGPLASRHGWLVPSSIWLTDDGEVLLREFGFGRLVPVEDVPPRDWTEYRFVGPELWGGQPDLRADLYSLGALLYETIGGKPTHDADDPETLIEKVREDGIAPAQVIDPTIPSEVDGWIMRLLRRNPGERPQAVEEISAKVDLALQSLPARPSNAELAAYLRQLFAARVPDLSMQQPQQQALPAPAASGVDDDEAEASPWTSFAGRPWTWWLVVAVLALVLAFFAWRIAAADEPAPLPSPDSHLVPPAAPPPAPAVRPPR